MLWSGLTLPALPRALLVGGVGRSPGLCLHGASQRRLSRLPLPLPATLSSETQKSQKRSVLRERDGGFPGDAASHASPSQPAQAGMAGHGSSPVASDLLLTEPAKFHRDAALR